MGLGYKMIIVAGMKNGGKSHRTLELMLYTYSRTRKCLIFDINNEYGDFKIYGKPKNVKRIALDDVKRYSMQTRPEVRRVAPYHDGDIPMTPEETEEALMQTLIDFRGGILLIEDLNVMFGDSLPDRVSGYFANSSHRCDTILHLQSVGRIVPKMWQNTEYLRLHKQLDDTDDSREKLKGRYEIFKIAELLINKHFNNGDKYYYLYIDNTQRKIMDAKKGELKWAIQEYVSMNDGILKPLLNKKDKSGSKIHDYNSAFEAKTKELLDKYYAT